MTVSEIESLRSQVKGLMAERDELQAYKLHASNMLDQLPDPDQHPSDLQCDYRAWLHDFDKELP